VKTSTGFNGTGAEIEKVEWMRAFLPKSIQIKASGGIRTLEVAHAMIAAGADRIGTSTAF
jgi:deoxyribose-phosphate aldolase